ncbi:MAG TPA: RNA-binding cell elongation regulator Jag/EloR [Candidatus Dormibacteraeota bacterium]|jgi:spoIIIJ-associated protein|nr:RNA-binding cell elongation regulator Jag/EloR [Candidatus Dormibacteraeota bacterium]
MPSIETTGKTIEEALDAALTQLQVPPERVEVEVLEEPGRAVLGLVGTAARIRVTVLKESALEAERFLADILQKMGIDAEVEHRLDAREDGPAIIDVKGGDLGVLIGWRGETLRALQLFVNTMVRQVLPDGDAIVVDVERYRARREDSVRDLALRVADRAKRNGERIGLDPMQPYERRVVHTTLAEDPDVSTESEGEEPTRRVVITPANARRQEIVNWGRGAFDSMGRDRAARPGGARGGFGGRPGGPRGGGGGRGGFGGRPGFAGGDRGHRG